MIRTTTIKKFFSITALSVLMGTATAFATPADLDEVNKVLHKTVDDVLAVVRNKKLSREQVKSQVMGVVNPVFDFPVMAKLTLGRTYWPKLKPEEQKQFTDLFIEQLQASYLDKVDLVSDEKVAYDKLVEEPGGRVSAGTRVISKEEPIKIVYKFYKAASGWKVFDVEIQDVSLVKSYSQQYQQILQQSAANELLRKMKDKIAETERLNKQKRGSTPSNSQPK